MKSNIPLVLTKNDGATLMHKDRESSLRLIADHLESYKEAFTKEQIIGFLRELADESEAMAVVTDLRDEL
jgi:hypothetical protein